MSAHQGYSHKKQLNAINDNVINRFMWLYCQSPKRLQSLFVCSNLCMNRIGYYFHSVNTTSLTLSQTDRIKRLPLYFFHWSSEKSWTVEFKRNLVFLNFFPVMVEIASNVLSTKWTFFLKVEKQLHIKLNRYILSF